MTGPLGRAELAARLAADIPAGSYVNLGIGLPTLVADQLDPAAGITLHTENGMLGMGRIAGPDEGDPDIINAGKQRVLETPGCAYFDHVESFAMIRGRHLDLCVLGAFQVSTRGDLANWTTGQPDAIPAVGGAMDLAVGARRVYVMMTLFDRNGAAKLVETCTYPLTAAACVDRVYTDHAVFDITAEGASIRETFGVTRRELRSRIGPFARLARRSCSCGTSQTST